ncbi:kinase-like domain-containing protein [Rhizophagus irregularis DAOM 181602=DAOM 197198]|nr:kinase-like domain-containing protein [Rhizophagus irregularis DAOM 181602=DAOM 197198]
MLDVCFDCKRPKTGDLCRKCISELLQPNWTSGNKYIDKFIQEAQLKANNSYEIIEWIPFNRLRNIEYLAHGGFSTIYKAIWLDGYINYGVKRHRNPLNYEDHKIAKEKDVKSPLNKNEKEGIRVALKSLKNSSNISDYFLNELKNHLQYICKGLRPEIVKGTLPVYARLMKRCWDSDPNKRPTADELNQIIFFWYNYYPKDFGNKIIAVPIY